MVTLGEYQILNSCADDRELFYFLFAEVNYGGQVLPGSLGLGYERCDDQRRLAISVPANEVVANIVVLIERGLIECWMVGTHRLATASDLNIYSDYNCLTFEDHIEQFGYGPHEFATTAAGIAEIYNPENDIHGIALGWV